VSDALASRLEFEYKSPGAQLIHADFLCTLQGTIETTALNLHLLTRFNLDFCANLCCLDRENIEEFSDHTEIQV